MPERRLFERFWARYPAKFKDSRNEYGTDVFLRDASAAGVRINTRERMFLDDPVALEVEVPDGALPMALCGRVKWTRPARPGGGAAGSSAWDVGVQFPQVDFMKMSRLFQLTLQP
ncbi:MAG: PilZ domain-containing protein [Candidatus Omnitrophica bacterium]|nr:PilZ domain-containing protein [Candidatus Omnitrophota bacterium]